MSVAALDEAKFLESITHNLTVLDSGARFRGGIDHMRDGVISGWVMDLLHRHSSIRVTLWMGEINVAETVASLFRSDISNYVENNLCGFWLDLNRLDYQTLTRVLASAAPVVKNVVNPFAIRLVVGSTKVNIDLNDYGIDGNNFRSQLVRTHTLLKSRIESKKVTSSHHDSTPLPSSADGSAEAASLSPSEMAAGPSAGTLDAASSAPRLAARSFDDKFPASADNILRFPPDPTKATPISIPFKINIVATESSEFRQNGATGPANVGPVDAIGSRSRILQFDQFDAVELFEPTAASTSQSFPLLLVNSSGVMLHPLRGEVVIARVAGAAPVGAKRITVPFSHRGPRGNAVSGRIEVHRMGEVIGKSNWVRVNPGECVEATLELTPIVTSDADLVLKSKVDGLEDFCWFFADHLRVELAR